MRRNMVCITILALTATCLVALTILVLAPRSDVGFADEASGTSAEVSRLLRAYFALFKEKTKDQADWRLVFADKSMVEIILKLTDALGRDPQRALLTLATYKLEPDESVAANYLGDILFLSPYATTHGYGSKLLGAAVCLVREGKVHPAILEGRYNHIILIRHYILPDFFHARDSSGAISPFTGVVEDCLNNEKFSDPLFEYLWQTRPCAMARKITEMYSHSGLLKPDVAAKLLVEIEWLEHLVETVRFRHSRARLSVADAKALYRQLELLNELGYWWIDRYLLELLPQVPLELVPDGLVAKIRKHNHPVVAKRIPGLQSQLYPPLGRKILPTSPR